MHDNQDDAVMRAEATEAAGADSKNIQAENDLDAQGEAAGAGYNSAGTRQSGAIDNEPDTTGPASEPGATSLSDAAQEKRSIMDILYGVIVRPIETLRYVADNKLLLAGTIIFVALAWLRAVAAIPGTLDQLNQIPELSRLGWLNPRTIAISTVIGTPFTALISLVIMGGIFHLSAKLFKGKGSFSGLLSAFAFANFPSVLTIPFTLLGLLWGGVGNTLSSVISFPFVIWVLVLEIIAIRENNRFSTGRAVAAYFVPLITFFVLITALIVGISVIFFAAIANR